MAAFSNSESLGGTPEASEFGASLRDMRVAHNTDVATVASTLRIRQVYLQAIEDGRFDDLPGPTYAAGFVRAYAEYLGLDIAETMQRYRDVTGNTSAQAPLVAPSPVVEGRMPTGFILLVAAVLAATAYGSWYYLSLHGRDAGDLVAKLPQQIADMVGLSSEEMSVPVPSPSSAPKEIEKKASEKVPENAGVPSSDATEVAAKKAAAEEPAAAGPALVKTAVPPPATIEAGSENVASVVQETTVPPVAQPSNLEATAQTDRSSPSSMTNRGETESLTTNSNPSDTQAAEIAAVTPVSTTSTAARAAVPDSPATAVTEVSDQAVAPVSAARPDAVRVSALDSQRQAALPEAPAAAPASTASRVVLRATAISWVELRDVAGKRVFSRLLKKGETYNVPAQPGITLATGNAGALDILVDGQTISPIGPPGAVRRDVLLEPEALLERSAGAR